MTKGRKLDIGEMHRKTSALATAAGEAGDQFLEYLYGLALRHLEERADPARDEVGERPSSADDAILAEIAQRLRKGR